MLFSGTKEPNTFIGGVSATINTPALLATKLAISVSRISNFQISGANISCRISGSYAIPLGCFGGIIATNNNAGIRSYLDGGLVTSISSGAFYSNQQQMLIQNIEFENVLTVGDYAFFGVGQRSFIKTIILKNCTSFLAGQNCANLPYLESCYIPRVTTLGATVGNNNVFIGVTSKLTIYAHPSLATNNAGAPDGDLQAAIALGATVRYVTNFTAPSPITDLVAVGNEFSNGLRCSFTVPSSTNAIDYYNVYVNGLLVKRLAGTALGNFAIYTLAPSISYNITVEVVDIFFQKSALSNPATATTAASNTLIAPLASYRLDANANDFVSGLNGVETAITYAAGKINNAAVFNGTTSLINLGNNVDFQLNRGSISCWVKTSNAGAGYREILTKQTAFRICLKDNVLILYDVSANVDRTTSVNVANNQWHHIVVTFQSGVTNGTKVYLDNSLVLTTTITVVNQTTPVVIGSLDSSGFQLFTGSIDAVHFYNLLLTAGEITDLYNFENAGNQLI